MNQQVNPIGVAPEAWLQHHLPWLCLLSLLMGLPRDSSEIGFDLNERNG